MLRSSSNAQVPVGDVFGIGGRRMVGNIFMAIGVVACLMAAAASWAGDMCAEPVDTAYGKVRGTSEAETDTCVWRGIRYARAPVGEFLPFANDLVSRIF